MLTVGQASKPIVVVVVIVVVVIVVVIVVTVVVVVIVAVITRAASLKYIVAEQLHPIQTYISAKTCQKPGGESGESAMGLH